MTSQGSTPEERARTSPYQFVRSQDHLSLFKQSSTGHCLTALQALDAYGIDALQEVHDYGSAILACSQDEPAATLRAQREALGLSIHEVAKRIGLTDTQVEACENKANRSPIRFIEIIAIALGLDERLLSVSSGAGADETLAVRLKTLGQAPGLGASAVMVISEAAWVIRTQARLLQLLRIERSLSDQFVASDNYGTVDYPAWQHGYYLADKTRQILGVSKNEPINSLRLVCEEFGIPLLHAELPTRLAGATVSSVGLRGIVINTAGYNQNVWVQRATIAHELGHLLWDPESSLQQVRVDNYDELDSLSRDRPDFVEARANAFAIALLAPLEAVKQEFKKHRTVAIGLRSVMVKFGISYSAAKYHVWNSLDRTINLDGLIVDDTEPTDDWRGREAYTDDFFPFKDTSPLRRGEFAGIVVAAEMKALISMDTACRYLQTTQNSYINSKQTVADLFTISADTSASNI